MSTSSIRTSAASWFVPTNATPNSTYEDVGVQHVRVPPEEPAGHRGLG
jgi:hypothetical protein